MYIILWEYLVKPEFLQEFKTAYAGDGPWTLLFQKADGYLGTELIQDHEIPCRFLTMDRWTSARVFEVFKEEWQAEYHTLDARYEGLTERETMIGRFTTA